VAEVFTDVNTYLLSRDKVKSVDEDLVRKHYANHKMIRTISSMFSHLSTRKSVVTIKCDGEIFELTEYQRAKLVEAIGNECLALQGELGLESKKDIYSKGGNGKP